MAQQVVAVVSQVRKALEGSPIAEIRAVHVESDGDRVVLSGIVESFYYKQLAQELVRQLGDGILFENAISVEYRSSNIEFD